MTTITAQQDYLGLKKIDLCPSNTQRFWEVFSEVPNTQPPNCTQTQHYLHTHNKHNRNAVLCVFCNAREVDLVCI